ncbi:MAG TPA: DUF4397 domain-containing protein [Burkholderiaceae bacterium]|nr:DUF4397 domain-containing protein [Burkholderiaceae bacterium]
MRKLLRAAGAIVACLLTACGSSSSTTPADIRLVNTTGTSVTMTLNGGYALTVNSNSLSGYEQVPPGTYTSSVSSVNGSLNPSSQTVELGTAEAYTSIAYARGTSVYSSTITDNLAVPAIGYATLDVANISPDAGQLDVYLLAPGTTSLSPGNSPNFSSVAFQTQSTAATFTAGSWNVIVTGAGDQSDVRLTLIGSAGAGAITLTSQQVGTLALTDTPGGTLVNAFVITQGVGGTVTAYPNTAARLRVLSAVTTTPPSAVVLTTTAGTVLPTVYAPNESGYVLVTAGDTIATITVAGTAIAIPAGAFAAGNDYTVLVYTSATNVSTAALLTDNNELSGVSSEVRVINGAVTPVDGVSVNYGGVPIATGVFLGDASAYTGVKPSASAILSVNGSGYSYVGAQPPFDPPVASVFTIFVSSSSSAVSIFRDR